jgi:hypothetical protein
MLWGVPGCEQRADGPSPTGRSLTMLWTILVILAIVALAIYVANHLRGRNRL